MREPEGGYEKGPPKLKYRGMVFGRHRYLTK